MLLKSIFKKNFIIFFLLYIFCLEKQYNLNEIHIDFVINNDNNYHFNRFVFIPEKKIVLLLFFNSDANYDHEILKNDRDEVDYKPYQTLNNKLNFFYQITNRKSDYFILFDKINFIKFIDFIEGIRLFLSDKSVFENSNYIHYDGEQLYFGEKLYEYIFLMERYDKDSYAIMSQNRHFRYQTFILNFIHQLVEKKPIFEKDNQFNYIIKFLQSNLTPEELRSFFETLMEYDFVVIEFPLILKKNIITKETLLFLNIDKSKMVYEQSYSRIVNISEDDTPITLEILNASSINRLANRVKSIIDSKFYKVLSVDNYTKELDKTYLISNYGNSLQLKKLKKLLHIQEKNVYFIRRLKDVGFSFILGKDFNIKTLIKQ